MWCRGLAPLLLGASISWIAAGSAAQPGGPALEPPAAALEAGQPVFVRYLQVIGNSVLTEAELIEVARPYLGRELGLGDLEALRDDLARACAERGYVTSAVVIPSQSLADGVLEIWIVEATPREVDVSLGRPREPAAPGGTAVR